MAQTQATTLPAGWDLDLDDTTYDSHVEKAFTRIAYTATDGTTVRIASVQEPNSVGGWGYLVWVATPSQAELGLVETLPEARELARSFMRNHEVGER